MPAFAQDHKTGNLCCVVYPYFRAPQDPASQLSVDLHTMLGHCLTCVPSSMKMVFSTAPPSKPLGARELENEREIMQYFKAAVAAADEA